MAGPGHKPNSCYCLGATGRPARPRDEDRGTHESAGPATKMAHLQRLPVNAIGSEDEGREEAPSEDLRDAFPNEFVGTTRAGYNYDLPHRHQPWPRPRRIQPLAEKMTPPSGHGPRNSSSSGVCQEGWTCSPWSTVIALQHLWAVTGAPSSSCHDHPCHWGTPLVLRIRHRQVRLQGDVLARRAGACPPPRFPGGPRGPPRQGTMRSSPTTLWVPSSRRSTWPCPG